MKTNRIMDEIRGTIAQIETALNTKLIQVAKAG